MKALALILGVVATAIGLLFVGQGTGYIAWPSESFMISQGKWAWYGAGIAIVGLLLVGWARRR